MDYKIKNERQLRDFYNNKAKALDISRPDAHYGWVLGLIGAEKGKALLDVACGPGFLLQAAIKRGLKTSGLDISPELIEIAKKNAPGSELAAGSGELLPWGDNSFDYVACLGSLEHFMHPDKGAAEMARVLKPGGTAAVLLPNSYFLEDIVKALFKGEGPTQNQDMERFAAKNEWKRLLEEAGFKVKKIHRYNEFTELFSPGTRKLKSLKKYLRFVRRQCYPFNLSTNFVYICTV